MTIVQQLQNLPSLGNVRPSAAQARSNNPAASDGLTGLQDQIDRLLRLLRAVSAELIPAAAQTLDLPFTTPEEHGAVGSGDDTAAINLALADGRTVVFSSQKTYIATPFAIPAGCTVLGLPGSVIKQKSGSAVANVPFISTANAATNIYLQGVVIDGNVAGNPVLGVCGLFLNRANGVVLQDCEIKNVSGPCIGGLLWKNVQIKGLRASGWGIGNDYAAIFLQDGIFPVLPTGTAFNILIEGCWLNGTGSGSCIKLTGTLNAPLSNVRIIGNYVKVGYPGAAPPFGTPEALGIEVWSGPAGTGGNNCSGVLISGNTIESQFAGILTYGQTWGISLSQVTDASVIGNVIRGCGEFAIEMLGSRLVCVGNQATNCGPIVIILSSIMALQDTFTVSSNSISTRPGTQFFGGPIAGIEVYSEGLGDLSKITIIGNQVNVQGAQRGIWFQNNGSGDMGSAIISGNDVSGDATIGSFGIVLSQDSTGDINNFTIEANHIAAVEVGIYPGGTNGRYLWNIFGPGITTNYGNTFSGSDMAVDVSNTEGVNFAPASIQLRGRAAPVIYPNGDIVLDQVDDTTALSNAATLVDSNPNAWFFNRVNFGSELQGGILSVNSRWAGSPNWIKTSLDTFARAMFVVFGAGRFGVKFGLATNSDDADPGTYAFRVDDNGGTPQLITSAEIYPTSIAAGQYLKTDGTGKMVGVAAIGAASSLLARGSGLYSLSNAGYADVPGMTITLDRTGTWRVEARVYFLPDITDGAPDARLLVNGVAQAQLLRASNAYPAPVVQIWHVSASNGQIVKIQARKSSGAGVSAVGTDDYIEATWLG